MVPFFADLVVRTDEARRAFETHPVLVAGVADGLIAHDLSGVPRRRLRKWPASNCEEPRS